MQRPWVSLEMPEGQTGLNRYQALVELAKSIKYDLQIVCRVSIATNILFNILKVIDVSDFLLIVLAIHRYILHIYLPLLSC